MKYQVLSKYYYQGKEQYEDEYKLRKNSLSAIHLEIDVHGNDAFIIMIPELASLIEEVYTLNAKLDAAYQVLPEETRQSFGRKCLIDEIMLTNDIEGVYSTRKEITAVVDSTSRNNALRFNGLVKKYMMLIESNLEDIPLETCEDIRMLYDEIVKNEINKKDWPDGKIFRSEKVSVISATQQEKHIGILTEQNVISHMEKALGILHNEEIPKILRISIFHYLTGYIHPFYDGNGRLSRFISSYLLSKALSPLVSYRLSYAIKNNKDKYYKIFDLCNDKKNKGDLTPFAIVFLELLLEAIENLYEKVIEGHNALMYFDELLKEIYSEQVRDDKMTYKIFFTLIQNSLFAIDLLDRNDLAKTAECSYQTITKFINKLVESGAPIISEKKGKRLCYDINMEKIIDYLASKESARIIKGP